MYREYAVAIDPSGDAWHVTNQQATVNYPGYPAQGAGPYPNPINHITIGSGDLAGATRAEAVMTIWGGHVGTTNKQISFNGNTILNIPELQTTPTSGQCYLSQANIGIDVPLSHLREGDNSFQAESGGQTCYSFGWGQWGLYGMIIRVYYDPATKSHVTGTVTSPPSGAIIGDNPAVAASVTGSASRVDFLAYYDGYDTDGDGVYLEYHHDYNMPKFGAMSIRNHVGTATGSPWSVTWQNSYVPDQSGVKMIARIQGSDGVWYVTQPSTGLTIQRSGSSVVMYKPYNVGEREWAKGDVSDGTHGAGFQIQNVNVSSIANISSATALIRTWHGLDTEDPAHYVQFNNYTFPTFGESYFAKLDILSVPPSAPTSGENTFTFYSPIIGHHGIEILWPGPALVVRYSSGSGNVAPSITAQPASQTVTVGQTATFSVAASGTAPFTYQWQKNNITITGATASSYTTPATVIGDNGSTYRCIVTNVVTAVTSNSATLTVTSAPPPSGLTSDDFSSGTLNSSLWTFINPRNDVSLSLVGTGTANAQLSLVVPAGLVHDSWTGGITAPRIMQAVTNTDFEVELKFDSPFSAGYQVQGVLIQQDATNFVRFDFVRDPSSVLFFAASFVNDVPTVRTSQTITAAAPFYMRVKRVGNQWTGSYSTNGSTWTQAANFSQTLTVASIGPWAGNAGSPAPAFTGLVDYFFNTASPIVPEDPTGSPVAPSITQQPANQTVTVGQTATFSVAASGTAPFTYQWQKNNITITGATASSYTTPATVIADNASTYQCIVTNAVTSVTSNSATLTVTTGGGGGGTNVLANGGFESGTTGWTFYTNGSGTFTTVTPGSNGTYAGRVSIATAGTNVQLYQAGITLEPSTQYTLSFDAYASAARTVPISIGQHGSPYTNYGLLPKPFALGTSWQSYSVTFTTSGFSSTVSDGRLMVWFADVDVAGDKYFFDNVVLSKAGSGNVAPSITAQPASQTVTVGQTATFSVAASGTAPFTYQWQKNNITITGATASSYTTPATVIGDNGSTYRCIVTNVVTAVTSNSATLTVTSAPPPSGLTSDDFSSGTLNSSLWTFINPRNDVSLSLVGTGTANAQLSLVVPAGLVHDSWTGGITAPRIMQAVTNTDFEVELKFDSPFSAGYQVQGVLIQQDATNFVRFDFVRDPSSVLFFAASFVNDVPTVRTSQTITAAAPFYMRVKRVGNQWTGSYSTNGSTWTQAANFSQTLTVASIGPWAGNAGSPAPAFTGLVDYFFNTASPIVPEDPTGSPVAPSITQQPANQTVTVGQTATFSVAASGTAPFTYQWQKNNTTITGATASSYTTPATVIADNASTYQCIVTNAVTAVTSNSATLTVTSAPPPTAGWWNTAWRYRVPVTVGAAGFQRTTRPAEVALNFTQLLTTLGTAGSLNENSLRVIEVTSGGTVIDSTVAFQFDKAAGYSALSNASGTVVFMLTGNTSAGVNRYYHIYFETSTGFVAPGFANLVTVTDNVMDEGESSYLVGTQGASYYYHKQGAGFSSILDPNGNDWINYHVGGGSAGEYRGIPNMGAWAHPGYTNSTSSLISSGPIKATIASQTTDGLWKLIWEFYPRFAKLTLQQANGAYWLLYEGTPGGTYNPSTGFWTRSSGERLTDNGFFVGDISSPEWAYFGDVSTPRFLFLAHHEDDNLEDQYWNMQNNMTVFGFGRQYATTTPLMTTAPAHLTIGFGEDTLQAVTTINSSFRDLSIIAGTPEINGGSPPPPSGIVSDNFNASSLNTSLWTFLNPRSDATATMTGSQLSISVPSGLVHDSWTGGITAPRVMQAAPNGDFEVEARFDATMTAGYQVQGILVQQDLTNFVRFDFVRDASATYFFAANFVNDVPTVRAYQTIGLTAPFYLRVKRAASQWTGSYSSDGANWTQAVTFSQALTVSSIGPWAGNAGSPAPSFTSLVNYFFNTASPALAANISRDTAPLAVEITRPSDFMLSQNYPNPFNPSTSLAYQLPLEGNVKLAIFDVLGREVAELVNGYQPAGYHTVRWDASSAATGIYYARFAVTNGNGTVLYSKVNKLILMK